LFADVNVRFTPWGKVSTFVYQPSELHVQFDYAYGGGHWLSPIFRFIPAVAVDGLFVSTYVEDGADLGRAFQWHRDKPITAFRILGDRDQQDYYSDFQVVFKTLPPT